MPAYLVRIQKTRDIVGFFFATAMDGLIDVVDECADPGVCEYIKMPLGGIMWTSPAISVPINHGSDEEEDNPRDEFERLPWDGASLSEAWWTIVYGYRDQQWTQFFPDNP